MNNGEKNGVRALTQRYCHVVGKNVAIEVSLCGHGESDAVCLCKSSCEKERGGCKNAFLPKGGHGDMV